MSTNVLKKVQVGNPLYNLEMWDELKEHDSIKSDEELATFYHKLLDKAESENRILLERFTWSMITYSTGFSFNPGALIP